MDAMRSVLVGYGEAARIHERLYPRGIEVVGVVEPDEKRRAQAEARGHAVFPSLDMDNVRKLGPDLYDVCTPTGDHYRSARIILESDPNAGLIIEKPVSTPSDSSSMLALIAKYPQARVSVNENYLSSSVNRKIRDIASGYGLVLDSVAVDFSKDRRFDVATGRFVDDELFVFGYEGPHMATCASYVCGVPDARAIGGAEVELRDMDLGGMTRNGASVVKRQGSGSIRLRLRGGAALHMKTAMDGSAIFQRRPGGFVTKGESDPYFLDIDGRVIAGYDPEGDNAARMVPDARARYRRIEVFGYSDGFRSRFRITGAYEPVAGMGRNAALVRVVDGRYLPDSNRLVSVGENVDETYQLEDNSMGQHLGSMVRYLRGERGNPSTVEQAVGIVDFLGSCVKRAL